MELSWPMKLRIAAAMAAGIVLLGIIGWPLAAPSDPLGVVSLLDGGMDFGNTVILLGLGFLAGLIGYFLSWPYGADIGVLAAPSGLAFLAIRTGSMAVLIRLLLNGNKCLLRLNGNRFSGWVLLLPDMPV